jgi:hypothetical protein
LTEGNVELLQILVSWAVMAPIVFAIILRDERRLDRDRLTRAWPPVSRDAAVFAMWMFGFHPVYLLAFFCVHFGRTRASLRGLGLGIGWSALVFAANVAAQLAVAAAVDVLGA